MQKPSQFASVQIAIDERPDGSVVLSNRLTLPVSSELLPERLAYWARERPDTIFLSEADGDGRRTISYAAAAAAVERIAARLLTLPISRERPLLLVGVNGVDHALLMLAAARIGVPAAIVSPAYCAASAAPWGKLSTLLDRVGAGLALADDPVQLRTALSSTRHAEIPCFPMRDLRWLDLVPPARDEALAAAIAAVTPDTVTKLLFTSGSTGSPKAVMNTQRMMVSNMQGLERVWPFLTDRPPILVDWLPWNHTFGGNCCFNLALYFGGTLHIDDGKPLPAAIRRTVTAIRQLKPSVYFNVPGGYEALLPFFEDDAEFAAGFFGRLDFLFNAGAPMPAPVRHRLAEAARRAGVAVPPIIGAWGSTETAPFSTVIYFETEHAGNLGVPMPGTEIKLVPTGGRTELRVRGPNVTPGYWHQPDATAAAFDEEGFYCIGDAGRFADPASPEAGLLFDGRVAENFKLSSGTWVNVGALRLAVIAATDRLVSDAVITGEARDEIGALLFLNETACRQRLGPDLCGDLSTADLFGHESIRSAIDALLASYNAQQVGSSTRIARFAILPDTPSAVHDEITDKGYINQRAALRCRCDVVEQLYAAPIPFGDSATASHANADAAV